MRVNTQPQVVVAGSAGASAAGSPLSASDPVLTSALDKLGGQISEILVLALEKESTKLETQGATKTIRALGKDLESQHASQLKQMRDAIDASQHKSWWQKLVTVFKVISIAAGALSGGTLGAIAAAMVATAMVLEKTHPKIALGLQLAASALIVSSAAGNLFSAGDAAAKSGHAMLDSASKTVQGLDGTLVPGSVEAASQAKTMLQSGACWVGGGAQIGAGAASCAVGYYGAKQLTIEAERLRIGTEVETAQGEQKDEVGQLRDSLEHGQKAYDAASEIGRQRYVIATAAIQV
jgi:hypothetical protein